MEQQGLNNFLLEGLNNFLLRRRQDPWTRAGPWLSGSGNTGSIWCFQVSILTFPTLGLKAWPWVWPLDSPPLPGRTATGSWKFTEEGRNLPVL